MKSFFIVVVLMLRNGGAQTRIGGAPRAKESFVAPSKKHFYIEYSCESYLENILSQG